VQGELSLKRSARQDQIAQGLVDLAHKIVADKQQALKPARVFRTEALLKAEARALSLTHHILE